jgi:hypothetical protein
MGGVLLRTYREFSGNLDRNYSLFFGKVVWAGKRCGSSPGVKVRFNREMDWLWEAGPGIDLRRGEKKINHR